MNIKELIAAVATYRDGTNDLAPEEIHLITEGINAISRRMIVTQLIAGMAGSDGYMLGLIDEADIDHAVRISDLIIEAT